ncbi:MAG: glycosyltransferase family 2 protein [Treponema sp.]|nr:glycosyltransferase family 2 protein [Treponema sp.]
MVDVSIIIVNYNTKDLLHNCLSSLFEHTKDIEFEVFVSDNASTDGSLDMVKKDFPSVIVIDNKKNLGFGTANNKALDRAKGKYVFYLNSDTVVLNNAVKIFFDYWENSKDKDGIGALGSNLLNEDCQIIHSYGNLQENIWVDIRHNSKDLLRSIKNSIPFLNKTHLGKSPDDIKPKHIGEVGFVTGADLFVRNDSFARFDERYFLYWEDSDLQKTMELSGKKRLVIDGPEIQHLKGKSDKSRSVMQFYRSVSKINTQLSSCMYHRKFNGKKRLAIFILKTVIFIMWLNPLLFGKTRHYIAKLVRI